MVINYYDVRINLRIPIMQIVVMKSEVFVCPCNRLIPQEHQEGHVFLCTRYANQVHAIITLQLLV
jgi:hypothetical protein